MLPTGNLRESRRGAKRASVIIVTKCPHDLDHKIKDTIIKKIAPEKEQQVFFTTISYDKNIKGGEPPLTISDLKEKQVLLVTGIANPDSLLSFLSEENIKYKHLAYPDHYNFTDNDIIKIKNESKTISSETVILTTEKDYMRLNGKIDNLCCITIKSAFLSDEEKFNQFVLSHVKNNIK